MSKNILIIGTGPTGATIARFFAEQNYNVDILEQRKHIAGNCYDFYNNRGVLVHKYGPHYFRTNSFDLLLWLSRFTKWIPSNYYVKAKIEEKLLPMPISLSTITRLKEKPFNEKLFKEYLRTNRSKFDSPQNAEEQCLNLVGSELYNLIFKNYTIKQWGLQPKDLAPEITARIPLRFNWDEKYLNEMYQLMPKNGYTELFNRILDHPKINLSLNNKVTGKELLKFRNDYQFTIYTGSIDFIFDYIYDVLPYRSLFFKWKHFNTDYKQPCVQINYPNEFNYTRSVEIKHITGQFIDKTTVCYEYPRKNGEPFYPIITKKSQLQYAKYLKLALKESKNKKPIFFLGRLAEYKYYNMDHVFLNALKFCKEILKNGNIKEWKY